MSKFAPFEKKISDCFDKKNYYEAHQVYRTLYFRLSAREQWDELQNLLYSGVLKLIEVNEPTSATDLAELYVEVLTKGQVAFTPEVLERFQKLFSSLPSTLEKDTAPEGQKVDRRGQLLSQAVKWSMSVSDKRRYKQKGHAALHGCVANVLWQEGNYCSARSHFMLSDEPEKFAKFLVDFQRRHGNESEKDLFIVQAVLQMLCNKRPRTASILLREYCQEHPNISNKPPYNLPLLNFARYVILAIRTKRVEVFTRLLEVYDLQRDPSFIKYLDKIGQVYLSVPPPQKQSGFLGSFIKGLIGPGQPDGSSESSSTAENEISEDEQFNEETDEEKEELNKILHTARIPRTEKVSDAQLASLQATDDMELD